MRAPTRQSASLEVVARFSFSSRVNFDGPEYNNTSTMLVGGIFYTDKRAQEEPSWVDYSVKLIEWMENSAPGLIKAPPLL